MSGSDSGAPNRLSSATRAVREFAKPESPVHAILFYGVQGAGKRQFAEELAQIWLSGEGTNAQAARSFANGQNPDFLVVEPLGASRVIKVRQITESRGSDEDFEGVPITEFVRTPPLVSEKKVVLIIDADRMMSQASNALLKSLEEPQSHVKYLLTTTLVSTIPATILSRCIAVACEIAPADESDPLWALAEGSPGRHADFEAHESVYRAIWQFAEALPNKRREGALLASEVLKGIADSLQKATDQNARSANSETLELLAVAIRKIHPGWHEALLEIVEAHRRVLRNGSAGLVFDSLIAKILR